jgi:hypothetical protein
VIKNAGFGVDEAQLSYPHLWWSREDLGIMQNGFGRKPAEKREETLINLIASKPVK